MYNKRFPLGSRTDNILDFVTLSVKVHKLPFTTSPSVYLSVHISVCIKFIYTFIQLPNFVKYRFFVLHYTAM